MVINGIKKKTNLTFYNIRAIITRNEMFTKYKGDSNIFYIKYIYETMS